MRTIWPMMLAMIAVLGCVCSLAAQQRVPVTPPLQPIDAADKNPIAVKDSAASNYILGPDDQISIWALGADEIGKTPYRIGPGGYIDLPLVGRMHASGLTVEQLKAELIVRLAPYVREPEATVSILDFRSQPVSVIGAVKDPGVHQLQGRKTLVEILSLAKGLAPDAGNVIKITRRLDYGEIPLPSAKSDPTGKFSVAEIRLKALMEAKNPEFNIIIKPFDVVSVPRAEIVYVMGEVMKPGGFVLNEQESLSVLQALSLAGGLTKTASKGGAKILRTQPGSTERQEIAVDLKRLLGGKSNDIVLLPEDILFVPNSAAKSAATRAMEAAIQIGIGTVVWRR